MKFIHLTDPHIMARPQKLADIDVHERLAAAVTSINAHHADAVCCMITGDITHFGEPVAFQETRDILDEMVIPCHLLIGNHDERNTFREYFPNTPVDGNGFVQFTLDVPAGRFIVLDTVEFGDNAGVLCDERLSWLSNALDDAEKADKKIFLFMHHAPLSVGVRFMDRIALREPEAFAELVVDRPSVRHLFFGHLHRACHGTWQGLPFSTLRAVAQHVAADLESSGDTLIISREDPNYGIVLIDDDNVIIHDHNYMREDEAFAYVRGLPAGAEKPPEHQKNWGEFKDLQKDSE